MPGAQPTQTSHFKCPHIWQQAELFNLSSFYFLFCFVPFLFFFICKQMTKEAERTAMHLGGAHPPQGVWGSLGHPQGALGEHGGDGGSSLGGCGLLIGMWAPHWDVMFQKQWDCSSPRGHNRARTDPSLSLWPPGRLGGSSQPTSHHVGRKRQRIFFQKRAGVTHHSQDIQQILSLK